MISNMVTFHISEAEAASDFPALVARVRAGAQAVIDGVCSPALVLRVDERPLGRLLSETLEILRKRNSNVILDGDFGRDLEEIIAGHSDPLDSSAWDD